LIITRTPVRVSFLGGGTDYPEHYSLHGGQTLGASINRYSYLTVNEHENLADYSIRVSYSRLELCQSVDEIEHPAVRESLRFLGLEGGMEIHYAGDLPARTGLGSSSSFTVGLLHALHAFKGELVCQRQLAEEAVHVERDRIGERVGVQDQYTCAHGGLLHLQFARDGKVKARPVPLVPDRLAALQDHLMLFFTKIRRDAHAILDEQLDQTRRGTIAADLGLLGGLVDQGLDILSGNGPIAAFGELLHTAWMTKRRLSSKVSTPAIDTFYERARQAGAVGGKLLGAGGGGFLLLVVLPEHQAAVESALAGLHRVRFGFDTSGSSMVFYQPT
jgi:D-glycero-alpha-D-manno-heptose-7-phosphate kinase